MKKSTKNALLFATAATGVAMVVWGENKLVKIAGLLASAISVPTLGCRIWKQEKKKIEAECQETERVFETTGLDPEKIETASLLVGTEDEQPLFGKTILQEIWKSSVLPDDMLEYNRNAYLNTLHVLQNVEKNRVIISIPLPQRSKGGLNPQDIRDYYKDIFDEFIENHGLDMKTILYQIGVVVTKGDENPPYTYYSEIVKDSDESFHEYFNRINSYQKESENGKKPRGLTLDEKETFLRIEQYLNLEFPIFPEHSNRKGLDLFSAVELIKILTEPAYIRSSSNGREINFDLNRVIFHPTDDYGTIFVIKGGKVETVDL